jgi:hypothetical protein
MADGKSYALASKFLPLRSELLGMQRDGSGE